MHSRVRRIDKLSRNKAVGNLRRQLIRLGDCALHALRALAQHQLRAIRLHQLAAFDAHGFRHDDDDAVASRRRNGRQTDARVAGCRFDDDAAFLEQSLRFRVVNHALGNAVLHRTGGVEILQLRQNMRVQVLFLFDMGQLQQRRMSNQLVSGGINPAHDKILLSYIPIFRKRSFMQAHSPRFNIVCSACRRTRHIRGRHFRLCSSRLINPSLCLYVQLLNLSFRSVNGIIIRFAPHVKGFEPKLS